MPKLAIICSDPLYSKRDEAGECRTLESNEHI